MFTSLTRPYILFPPENDVDGEAFLNLEEKHLNSMGISLGQSIKLLRYIASLPSTSVSPAVGNNDHTVNLIGDASNRKSLGETSGLTTTPPERDIFLQIVDPIQSAGNLMGIGNGVLSDLLPIESPSMSSTQPTQSQNTDINTHLVSSLANEEVYICKTFSLIFDLIDFFLRKSCSMLLKF